jgi:hypothetical protein
MELYEAVEKGDIEAVKQHLADGADVNAETEDGKAPLDWAEEVKDWHASEDIVVKKETADLRKYAFSSCFKVLFFPVVFSKFGLPLVLTQRSTL